MKTLLLTTLVLPMIAAATPALAQERFVFGFTGANPQVGAVPGDAVLTFDGITPFAATDTGWIQSNGQHGTLNSNYGVGTNASGISLNNYFSFVLGAAAPLSPYTSAVLTIRNGTSMGPYPITYTLYDVSATPLQLDAERSAGDTTGQALYADLGSGTSYGSFTFPGATTTGTFTSITLNQTFISRVNQGLLLTFAIGGSINPAATPTVPEPASWALMLAGFGAVGVAMRRRTKVRTAVTFA